MNSFLETINYSSSNEDSYSEWKTLSIGPDDSILCITGSGARPLDLLIKGPREIVSLDFNPCQNFLLELKIAAIKQLRYGEYLEFMGILPSEKREIQYKNIRQHLSAEAKNFWDSRSKMIREGVIYQGRWEKNFGRLAWLLSCTRSKLRNRLFASKNITEQTKIWHDDWDDFFWRVFLFCLSSQKVWKYVFGDPGFYKHVPEDFSISKYLNERFAFASENILFNKSPFLMLLFLGRYNIDSVLPSYLSNENFVTIKNNLSHLYPVTQSLLEHLEHCEENRFNKYSLSDFSSYTNVEEYAKIWKEIIRTASQGTVVCERQFLVKRELPSEVRSFVIRDTSLEMELARMDNSCFYTFIVGRINSGDERI